MDSCTILLAEGWNELTVFAVIRQIFAYVVDFQKTSGYSRSLLYMSDDKHCIVCWPSEYR